MKHMLQHMVTWGVRLAAGGAVLFVGATLWGFNPPADDFATLHTERNTLQILDRSGAPLSVSYQTRWNQSDVVALHAIPELLQHAFVLGEDKRFFSHRGVDWAARGSALWQRLRYGNHSRGASTITEQVVRMLHPRPRNYWTKWLEGLEATALEMRVSKAAILEFYLNQVPYASNRRGVVQAARFYFNRTLATLSPREMLALAVLVRAPSKFDLYEANINLDASIARLANALVARGQLEPSARDALSLASLELSAARLPIEAFAFVDYVRSQPDAWLDEKILTTLDGSVQQFTTELLGNRLRELARKNVHHAAALVVNHRTHEILAWVSIGAECKKTRGHAPGCKIDMVQVPRQPGSALKPFLYAAALQKGWSAATLIDDSPYAESVGSGIHHFHNYSNMHYGKVTLRNALGNSLNIPALHTINYVTPKFYLQQLQQLGFESLSQSANFYDEGLALGNGEVSLFELVQAYTTLANRGSFAPLKIRFTDDAPASPRRIYSPEVASLIGNILSDPWARTLEFGRGSVLNFPTQTAVKTGTSTDYRDAWAVGYNHELVVGIWMGNADYTPTDGITGSVGPALALRSLFNELTQYVDTAPLYLSPKLIARDVCVEPKKTQGNCTTMTEYFLPQHPQPEAQQKPLPIRLIRPANGLQMAIDPRIPRGKQAFEMRLSGTKKTDVIEWRINGKTAHKGRGTRYLWPTTRGKHRVQAVVWRNGKILATTATHRFVVK